LTTKSKLFVSPRNITITKGEINIPALKTGTSFNLLFVGLNKIVSNESNTSRSRLTKKFNKTYSKVPKLRGKATNRPETYLRNSNETTEDRTARINSPLNHNEVPRTFSGLKANTQSNPKVIRSIKSSWGLHDNIEKHKREECVRCEKLLQIINEKNGIIEELEKEKQQLKQKLNLVLKSSIKPIDKKKPLPQRNQLTKLRNLSHNL